MNQQEIKRLKELDRLYRRRSSFEMKYASTDAKRLREFKAGGITEETARLHSENCDALETICNQIQQIEKKVVEDV